MDTLHAAKPAETPAAGVPPVAASAEGTRPQVELPEGYADAEQLAREMLAAAERGDWPGVTRLRRRIPGLARTLHRQWLERRPKDAASERGLEKARIAAMRRVLVVDDQIRALADASDAQVDRWLRGAAATRTLN
jgi:hypothetical protein